MASHAPTAPFASAAEAWFWTASVLAARREGASRSDCPVRLARPCEPDDVIRCLDRLFTEHRIGVDHARVLRSWGERRMAPDTARGRERDTRLWREALDRLGPPLKAKGIIA